LKAIKLKIDYAYRLARHRNAATAAEGVEIRVLQTLKFQPQGLCAFDVMLSYSWAEIVL